MCVRVVHACVCVTLCQVVRIHVLCVHVYVCVHVCDIGCQVVCVHVCVYLCVHVCDIVSGVQFVC